MELGRSHRSWEHVTKQGLGPERVRLGLADSVWVLSFVQERFHNSSPGDSESRFSRAGDSETKEGLQVEEATGETRGRAALILQKVYRKELSWGGAAVSSLESQRKRGPWRQVQGVARDKPPLPTALLVASLMGPLESRRKRAESSCGPFVLRLFTFL